MVSSKDEHRYQASFVANYINRMSMEFLKENKIEFMKKEQDLIRQDRIDHYQQVKHPVKSRYAQMEQSDDE